MMRVKTRALAITLVATAGLSVGPASAMQRYCAAPLAPMAMLRKPMRPACAASQSCNSWEVDSYRSDVATYFRRLRAYSAEVDDFYNRASDFIDCMSRLD
jgi:hypothetical protein